MIDTLLTFGWKGDFYKLYKCAKRNNSLGRLAFKLYCKQRNCYIGAGCIIADDVTFPHLSGVHIASYATIGSKCIIHQNVTIGSNYQTGSKNYGVPTIGDNVFIGANACIVGGVKIGNNVRIGAGCVIVEYIPDSVTVVMQKPRIIKDVKD